MNKEDELMVYLHEHIFVPILDSQSLKSGVRLAIARMRGRDAAGMIHYYWSAVIGTEWSTSFARLVRDEGFTRFVEVIDDFRDRFNDRWLRS